MQQEDLTERFTSTLNRIVILMLTPTHRNVPGKVFTWLKKTFGDIWGEKEYNFVL